MKTAIEELIETFEAALNITVDDQTRSIFLEKEREQLMASHENGQGNRIRSKYRSSMYYRKTFNK